MRSLYSSNCLCKKEVDSKSYAALTTQRCCHLQRVWDYDIHNKQMEILKDEIMVLLFTLKHLDTAVC